jgi:hypothetical protein
MGGQMLRGLVLATLFVLTIGGKETASANDALPSVVLKGLQEMQDGGCRDAFDLWTSQWQSGDDVVRRQQPVSSCAILSQAGGAFRGYDVVKDVGVTPRSR